ncbi:MAG TPA: discoidin domain-containing protein [Puia sp.]|jgi:hypothetical protein
MTKYIRLFPLLLLLAQGACKKDQGLDSKDLLVYMQGDLGDANNKITAVLTQTPLSVWGNKTFQLQAYSTRQMTAAAEVYVYPDSTAVTTFNQSAGKHCILMPAGAYSIDANQHRIGADSMLSDPLTVTITDPSLLTDTNGYVLPMSIEKISSQDKGVAISANRATAYLYVPYAFTNIDTVQTLPAGALMTRTGWSVTVSNTTSGSLGPAMLDGSNSTAWRSSNSSTAAKWVVLNMKSVQAIKGFQLTPDYVSTGDNATQIRVSTSTDSLTWTVQGIWKGTGPVTGSNATSPDLKGIGFLAPVQAQYFRFDILTWTSGSRTGIGELNALQ